MRLLWFTWKDREHPAAGGAEAVNELLARELVRRGHQVEFVVGGFPGCAHEAVRDGFRIVRVGGRWTVYCRAFLYYRAHCRGRFDLVIDEVNTVPFFASLYAREPVVAFFHQLAREIWFYEMPWPIAAIGYLLEPLYLRLVRPAAFVTVSESSRRDLARHGAPESRIRVIPQALDLAPAPALNAGPPLDRPVMLSFGAGRAMKRGEQVLRAFEIAKLSLPALRLLVAGEMDGAHGRRLRAAFDASPYRADISAVGRVKGEARAAVYAQANLLCAASVKEGWGLVVSEAASQGVPAVVYDVDGLRDSVTDGVTGTVLRENTPQAMADEVIRLLRDAAGLEKMRRQAWERARTMTPAAACDSFERVLLETLRDARHP